MRLRSTVIVTALVVAAAVFTAGPAAAARSENYCSQKLAAVDYWSNLSLQASNNGNTFLARIYANAASGAYLDYVNASC